MSNDPSPNPSLSPDEQLRQENVQLRQENEQLRADTQRTEQLETQRKMHEQLQRENVSLQQERDDLQRRLQAANRPVDTAPPPPTEYANPNDAPPVGYVASPGGPTNPNAVNSTHPYVPSILRPESSPALPVPGVNKYGVFQGVHPSDAGLAQR